MLRATFDIIALRRKHQVPLGDGGHADLAQAIRAHANLVEFAPLGLLGLGCLELNGVPSAVVGAAGALFFCGRLLHYRAMHVPFAAERARHIAGRVRGMQITLTTLGATAVGGALLDAVGAAARVRQRCARRVNAARAAGALEPTAASAAAAGADDASHATFRARARRDQKRPGARGRAGGAAARARRRVSSQEPTSVMRPFTVLDDDARAQLSSLSSLLM
jgi:uncharacterized membrane protein YecN with MAPEG domain